ncbi:MAG: SIS domain-containing protein [Proteobacteria bacterium]|nr:SIS domain-containing protein [Pseudomonadota bacterium]
MDVGAYYRSEFEEHRAVAEATAAAMAGPFRRLVATSVAALKAGGKLMFFGNGGSAAAAQHLATELTVRYITNRKAIAAVALTTDTSALTAIGNDLGFDQLFARQIEAIGRKGDVAIAITTSGKSPNVILALKAASAMGIVPAALSGKGGGDLPGLADPLLIVPSNTTARIQEMHITLGQMLCGAVERELGLA